MNKGKGGYRGKPDNNFGSKGGKESKGGKGFGKDKEKGSKFSLWDKGKGKKGKEGKDKAEFYSSKNESCARFCTNHMTDSCRKGNECTFAHAPHELMKFRELKTGVWLCINCGYVNGFRDKECKRCNTPGPDRDTLVFDERRGDFTRNPGR